MTKLLSVCIGIQRGAGAKRILCRDREDPEKAAGKLDYEFLFVNDGSRISPFRS